MQDKKLESYLRKLLEIQENERLEIEDLKAIAMNMGMDEADWQAVREALEDHLTRGQGHLDHQQWTDAIDEFTEARAIDPYDTSACYGLAQAYHGRWQETGEKEDRKLAGDFARATLDLDPGHLPSFELLSALKTAPASPAKNREAKIVILLIGGILLIVFLAWMRIPFQSPVTMSESAPIPAPASPDVPPSANQLEAGSIPIRLLIDDRSRGMNLQPVLSTLSYYPTQQSFGYKLRALISEPESALTQLSLRMEMIDQDGQVVQSKTSELLSTLKPASRPGDQFPLAWDYFEKDVAQAPALSEIRLTVTQAEKYGAESSYPTDRLLPLSSKSLPGVSLEITERSSQLTKATFKKGSFQKGAWAFRNTGKLPLNTLKLRIDWLGEADQVLSSKDFFVVSVAQPPLAPGAERVWSGTWSLDTLNPEDVRDYRLTVIQTN